MVSRAAAVPSSPHDAGRAARWTHRFAWVLSGATVVLLLAGALVTSTGSGLAVPDWPLAYGRFFPPMVGGILYEHGHRMVAGVVGLLTLVYAGWLWLAEPRRSVRWLGTATLAAVIVQALLGGITVLLLLPKAVSISHALLAQGFFLLTVTLVQVTAPAWRQGRLAGAMPARAGRTGLLAALSFAALVLTLLLGAMVRHFGAGLAIPDFPLAYGGLIPPLGAFPVVIHFLHRVGALAAALLIAATLVETLRRHRGEAALVRPALAMAVLVALQILLGGGIIWSLRAVPLTALHLVNGALLLAAAWVLLLRATRLEAR